MKKFAILALAVVMVIALTVPAAALENEFGGYWRTRFFTQGHFDGESDDARNRRQVDTRTRLYYTAKINDNLKFVNKFEMDAVWGGQDSRNLDNRLDPDAPGGLAAVANRAYPTSYGDVGADGVAIEVKQSYADFNTGPVNWTVGVQSFSLFRSFYIDAGNDASGVIARWKVADNAVLAGSWLKLNEGGAGDGNNEDIDSYTIGGGIWFSENISLKPAINYARSSELNSTTASFLIGEDFVTAAGRPTAFGELELFTYGFDFDMAYDNFGLWVTAAMQDGDAEVKNAGRSDFDISSYLVAIGGNVMLGPVDLHGQGFIASGDEDGLDDDDLDAWFATAASYYWSEIMGQGLFDNQYTANNAGDVVSNLMVANIGASMQPMDKLKVAVDLWYAKAQEDIVFADGSKEDYYGTELDVRVTYELVEGLNLDLVGAYLWAGDATSLDGNNDEDPYEFGAQLSLSF
jgi:hypothetical protein